MWADLRAKYAGSKHTGEPQLSQGTYSDGVQQGPDDKNEPEGGNPLDGKHGSVEERVTQFYEVFLPSKLSKLSKILFRYKGKEAQLLEDLRARYGGKTLAQVTQQLADDAAVAAAAAEEKEYMNEEHMDEEHLEEDHLDEEYLAEEGVLDEDEAAYIEEGALAQDEDHPNPLDSEDGSVEERVTRFYELAIPSKLSKLHKILFRYKDKGAQLLEDMRAKYGGQSVSQIRKEVAEEAEMEASGDYGEGGAKEQVPALPVEITVWVGNAVYGVGVSVVVWAHSLHHSGKSLCEESVSSAEGWLYTQTPHHTGDQ